jgi:hypothetical protein
VREWRVAIGAILMAFVIIGSVYPVPPYPCDWLPYTLAGYRLIGLGRFGCLGRRAPDARGSIEHDMEEA